MSAVPFDQLPDDARVWVFASPRPLTAEQAGSLLAEVDRFIDGWLAHGHPVVGARDLKYDRFLWIGADEAATGVSGCSIDTLYRTLKGLEARMGLTLLDASQVWFRGAEGDIEAVDRSAFRERARAGEVDAGTIVFDNTVREAGQLRHGGWEKPAHGSWHARLLE